MKIRIKRTNWKAEMCGLMKKRQIRADWRQYHRKPLNDRDGRFLKFCFDQYFVSRSHVAAWLLQNYKVKSVAGQKSATIRMLNHLHLKSWIRKSRPEKLNHEEIYSATPAGIEIIKKLGYLSAEHTETFLDDEKLRHDYLVTDIRLKSESFLRMEEWIPERYLRNGDDDKIPDAVLLYRPQAHPKPLRIGIEVENTLKSRPRYERKFGEYNTSPYDLVFYFTADDTIKQTILDVSQAVKVKKIFSCSLSDFVRDGARAVFKSYHQEFPLGDKFV